jgi:hypothetical protein
VGDIGWNRVRAVELVIFHRVPRIVECGHEAAASGRGGPFVEMPVVRRARLMPFVRGGHFFGEDPSWVAGGGIDPWLTDRAGLRLLVQDAFRSISVTHSFDVPRRWAHEPSFQIGWVWK